MPPPNGHNYKMPQKKALLEQICMIAQACGKYAQQRRKMVAIETKSDGSLVTEIDRAVDHMLQERLTRLVPNSHFWGEETEFEPKESETLWAVDPIDGTTNFIFGSPLWGISIGLLRGNNVELGVICLPDLGITYSAHIGLGAYRNQIEMPQAAAGPILSRELVSYSDNLPLAMIGTVPGKMRYLGAWVAEAAQVFEGVFRGAVSTKASLYDLAGSICIARELGMEVTYADGAKVELPKLVGKRGTPKPILFFPKDHGYTVEL